jgi:4-amino-4-deoxy-L-arabinose transferase-like glycosyltransferase
MKNKIILFLIITLAAVLRLYALDKFPAGLNADEAAIGYNAYSLLETGKDEHSATWPLAFRSFDDYKPPLYFYLVLPFVKVLGLNIWAVRLPSAILGIASVYLIYLLTSLLFGKGQKDFSSDDDSRLSDRVPTRALPMWSPSIPLLSALILAISPWHLHFSRGGWESNAATFFVLLGVWAFIKALDNLKYFFLSSLSLVASLYTYHSMRIITPLLFISLVILYRKPLTNFYTRSRHQFGKHVVLNLILAFILLQPLAKQMLSPEGQSRFSGVSVFSDQGPLWEALERRRQSGDPNSIQTRVIHNKYLTYSRRFLSNYLSHYSPRFLFITGDEIARSKVPGVGQSYPFLAPFYLLGILYLLKANTKGKKFVLFWFLVAPLAAALTFQSPHALRSQNMAIPLTIITAFGVYQSLEFVKKYKKSFLIYGFLLTALSFYSTARYLHQYYIHYPQELGFAWQYGFDKVASYVKENGGKYDSIIISNRYDQPYIIMAFFLQYPPGKFQNEIELVPRDKFGFSTVNAFGNLKFKEINWSQDSQEKNTLIVTTEEGAGDQEPIYQVLFPNQKPAFKFYETTRI